MHGKKLREVYMSIEIMELFQIMALGHLTSRKKQHFHYWVSNLPSFLFSHMDQMSCEVLLHLNMIVFAYIQMEVEH